MMKLLMRKLDLDETKLVDRNEKEARRMIQIDDQFHFLMEFPDKRQLILAHLERLVDFNDYNDPLSNEELA